MEGFMFNHKLLMSAALAAVLFSGCGGMKSMLAKKVPPPKPQIFVFPFDCACQDVSLSSSVTTGFISGLPETVEPLDLKGFEMYLSTRHISTAEVTGVAPAAPAAPVDPASPDGSTPPAAPPAADPFAAPPAESYSSLVASLFTKRAARERFFKATEIEYVVVGRGKERVLDALQAGNLITLQNADIKLLDVKTGEVIVDDSFKQGIFEIVAADRIGKKLADKVIDKFKEIAKDEKRQRKLEKKREKRRRALTD